MLVHIALIISLATVAVAYCPEACTCSPTEGGQNVKCIGRNLTNLPKGLPIDTIWLNVRNNGIKILDLDDLKTLSRLKGLDVSGNKITTIRGTFEYFPNIVNVQLYDNMLTTVSPSTFGKALTSSRMHYVSLNNNLWNCDCNLIWMVTEMNSENSPLSSQGVKCDTPEELHGNYTADVDVDKLVCKRSKEPPRLPILYVALIGTLAPTAMFAMVAAAFLIHRRRAGGTPLPFPVPGNDDGMDGALNAPAHAVGGTAPKSLRGWLFPDQPDSRDLYQSS